MSQVSTDTFDFIFKRKKVLSRRIDKMAGLVERSDRKLDKLMGNPNADPLKIEEVQQLRAERFERFDALRDELTFYQAIPLPKDDLSLDNFRLVNQGDRGSFFSLDVKVTDSPYDSTYIGGEKIKVRVQGEDGRFTAKVDPEVVDGSITFKMGYKRWADLVNSGDVTLSILGEDNSVLFSTDYSTLA